LAGAAGVTVNYFAQSNEVSHQQRIANTEQAIALNEVEIARLEREASGHRLDIFRQKLASLTGATINAEVVAVLAKLNEQRALRQLESAIFLSYLYERAVAFFLGEPGIRHIRFDYLDQVDPVLAATDNRILEAAKCLQEHFRLVQGEFNKVNLEKIDNFTESISLRASYPLEFSRFLQTGEMEFVYSLYQLSKRFPFSHQCRLREVGVQLDALVPPTGFSGTLTHTGRYVVRDKKATLDPAVTRLVPTDQQLAEALEAQRRDGLPVTAVGGLLYYDLDSDTKILSQKTQFVSEFQPREDFTLSIFEQRGPTGLWKLKIFDQGQLGITDILIHFAIVTREADPDELGPKVEELVRAYETELAEGDSLDQVAPFSLRQNFPDTFFNLQNGVASLTFTEDDFPEGQINLKFKQVIAQALDKNNKALPGVELEISKPEAGFLHAGVTRADGFSEDLDAPPPALDKDQRFPITGAWQVRLADPSQFANLGDLRVFFIYAFEVL
jgi:hypothetical protein